jgi:siderophore synthetase component
MNADAAVFRKHAAPLGDFWLRPLRIEEDAALIHDWVNRDYAKYWGMLGHSREQVASAYAEICRHSEVFLGFHKDKPAFLTECYPPATDPVGRHYAVQPGDRGMHILVAPAERPIPNFTWTVFTVVMDFLFSDPAVDRVVVEPDARNDKIHLLNRRAGFEYQKLIQLPNKTAFLAFCTREKYAAALAKERVATTIAIAASPERAVAHLEPHVWAKVNASQIRKAISEFAHELLIRPELRYTKDGWGHYALPSDRPGVEYRFRAQLLSLDHWHLDPGSIEKLDHGKRAPLDGLSFIIEFSATLGIDAEVLSTYLEEIASTLYGGAYKQVRAGLSAAELTCAEFQEIETSMTEGHPIFLANSGRIGFDAIDYRAYAPEAAPPVSLIWLAAHKSQASFACIDGLTYEALLEHELGAATIESFHAHLRRQGLDPKHYLFLPAHPWQWFNKLAVILAPDLAIRHLVCLGYGTDVYLAQQSIRTFFNVTHPRKHYVKTALSILNMGFMRGLSPYYMSTTPAINQWIHRLFEQDAWLAGNGFTILREVASLGYRNPHFEMAIQGDSPYKKMLAVLWRESPIPSLQPGQRLMTMAALLHVDRDSTALLPQLIRSSGLDTTTWLRRYLRCYLSPMLHCFYAHDLVFMPHGENLILVLEENVPVRAIMKDIGEEAAVLNTEITLPEKVRRLSVSIPENLKVLSIFTDVFDCIFRYLACILATHGRYPEAQFWRLVAECVLEYQESHPELAEKFRRHDLFAPEFRRSCLNRLQLGNNRQMIDLADPAKNLKFAGTLKNPIAAFRPSAAAPRALAEGVRARTL